MPSIRARTISPDRPFANGSRDHGHEHRLGVTPLDPRNRTMNRTDAVIGPCEPNLGGPPSNGPCAAPASKPPYAPTVQAEGSMAQSADRSWASSESIRRTMLGNRSRDTKPELAVRRAVHYRGMRYRVATRPLRAIRRTADLVFSRARVAVFVDGCFWHGCPSHFVPPKTNPEYWHEKIQGNVARDRNTDRLLAEAGWTVVRVWEHQDPEVAADAVEAAIRGNSA